MNASKFANEFDDYAGEVFAAYGSTLPMRAVERVARDHSVTVADLVEDGMKLSADGSVNARYLFTVLGY